MTTTPVPQPAGLEHKETGTRGEGGVVGIIGNKRLGKGIVASLWLYTAERAGVPVFHLGNLAFGSRMEDLDVLARQDPDLLKNCVINLDEVKAILPAARASSTFQILVANNFVQSGHQNMSVLWTAISENGVAPALLEQTEFVLWIDNLRSRARRWTRHKGQSCEQYARSHEKPCNHCAAWNPDSPFHAEHTGPGRLLDCRESPHQRVVTGVLVSQEASAVGVGTRVGYALYCAHRFYPLQNTDARIESSVLSMTSANMADRIDYELQTKVKALLLTLSGDLQVATTDHWAESLEG